MSSRFLIGEGLAHVENVHTIPLENKGLHLYRGWSETVAEQLVEHSREDEIRQFTPKDASERFVTPQTAREWYREKPHVVYALGREALEGIAWFTHTPHPDLGVAAYTFAIRMYESQRGHGMAGALLEAVHKDFETAARYEGDIWLEADASNERALRFYEKHGYERVSSTNDRVLMVRKGIASVS